MWHLYAGISEAAVDHSSTVLLQFVSTSEKWSLWYDTLLNKADEKLFQFLQLLTPLLEKSFKSVEVEDWSDLDISKNMIIEELIALLLIF